MPNNEELKYQYDKLKNVVNNLKMRVLVCPRCQGYVAWEAYDSDNKQIDAELQGWINDGFKEVIETVEEKNERSLAWWKRCLKKDCIPSKDLEATIDV